MGTVQRLPHAICMMIIKHLNDSIADKIINPYRAQIFNAHLLVMMCCNL
jgi:hypothetical protein